MPPFLVTLTPSLSRCGGMFGADFACPDHGDLPHSSLDACQIRKKATAEAACSQIEGCKSVVVVLRGGSTLKAEVTWPARFDAKCRALASNLEQRIAKGKLRCSLDDVRRWQEYRCGEHGRPVIYWSGLRRGVRGVSVRPRGAPRLI